MTEWQILLLGAVTALGSRHHGRHSHICSHDGLGPRRSRAFIGAGGLGVPIVSGLQLANTTLILSGAIPAAILALVVDGALGVVERWVKPKGIEIQRS